MEKILNSLTQFKDNFETLNKILSFEIFSNSIGEYIYAIILFFVSFFFVKIVVKTLIKIVHEMTKQTNTRFDDIFLKELKDLPIIAYWLLYLYLPLHSLSLSPQILTIYKVLTFVFLTFEFGKLFAKLANEWIRVYVSKKYGAKKATTFEFLTIIAKILIWVIGILLLLSNLGIEIGPLATSLGIAGIAIAFALQNILEDIFSSLAILTDKPFRIGDFIVLPSGNMGTVKEIGIKTTRIKDLQGEELVVSNRELTSSQIQNYGIFKERRVSFDLRIDGGIELKKLKKVQKIVQKSFEGLHEKVELDRVHFDKIENGFFLFPVVYYVRNSDYNLYMEKNQEVLFKILEAFEKEKIKIATPSQKITLEK